jgi:hypothetical protein
LREHLSEPRRAVDFFAPLFKSEIGPGSHGQANGETQAHQKFLLGRRLIRRYRGDDGVYRYVHEPDTTLFDAQA